MLGKCIDPILVFLTRPMYLLKECQRLLQKPARELLEAPDIQEEAFRPVDVIAMEATADGESGALLDDVAERQGQVG